MTCVEHCGELDSVQAEWFQQRRYHLTQLRWVDQLRTREWHAAPQPSVEVAPATLPPQCDGIVVDESPAHLFQPPESQHPGHFQNANFIRNVRQSGFDFRIV